MKNKDNSAKAESAQNTNLKEPVEEPAKHSKFDGKDFLILLIILGISLFLRIYALSLPAKMYFDENHYVPGAKSYLSSVKKDPNYVHPPLGKEIMSIFLKIYGDTPVGWRAGSVVFGLLMIIITYLLSLSLFKERFAAAIASFLLGIEFLHIAQSRIATLDIYIAFFILLGYYFAWLFVDKFPGEKTQKSPRTNFFTKYKYALLMVISMGLATSVKLSGVGAAFGVFLFIAIGFWVKDKKFPIKEIAVTVGMMVILIPGIYLLSHIPLFIKGIKPDYLLYKDVFRLHYNQEFKHPYLSQMWQWPTVHRPIWYFWEKNSSGVINGILAFGSLLFWWSFIPVLLDMVSRAFKDKNLKIIFILSGYLPLYLFWLSSISNHGGSWHFKGGFFYYMLPCVPFMALGLAETLSDLKDSRLGKVAIGVYLTGLLVFLFLYYPILAGTPINQQYYDNLMRLNLFKSWN